MRSYDDYTVAVVCAMEFEMSAVRYMFDEEHPRLPKRPGDPNRYILGRLSGHDTVVAWLPEIQGKSAAATVATNLARSFPHVKWHLMVGIGGGVPQPHDVRLGDVVVSNPGGTYSGVVQYDLGKDTEEELRLKGFLSAPPSEMRTAVGEMRSDHRVKHSMIERYIRTMLLRGRGLSIYGRPDSATDILFAADYQHVVDSLRSCRNCDPTRIVKRPDREDSSPAIHYGVIASGDRVVRSATKRDLEVRNLSADILCFEMEAAGLNTEFSYLVIRGISDYADSHKNDAWQHYAAATAAACTKELLTYLDPERVSATHVDEKSDNRGVTSFAGAGIQNVHGSISVGRDLNVG